VQTVAILAVGLVAALVSGTTGFGYGVVVMSVLPLILGVRVLNPVVTILSGGNSLFVLWLCRRDVRFRALLPLLAGAMVGIPLGLFLLGKLDESVARRILGAVVAGYVVYNVVPLPRLRREVAPAWGVAVGLLGGALGGAFAMGGPPVVIYLSLKGLQKDEMRASLAAYFVATYAYKIPLLALGGFFTAEALRYTLLLLAPTVVGVVGGHLLASRISNRAFQWALLALLSVTAARYLVAG
jgi:uncharacterized protein